MYLRCYLSGKSTAVVHVLVSSMRMGLLGVSFFGSYMMRISFNDHKLCDIFIMRKGFTLSFFFFFFFKITVFLFLLPICCPIHLDLS